MPYVFHPFHLAEQMTDEESTAAALLHDVVEDTEITLNDLRKAGFSDDIITAVSLLTHNKPKLSDEEYFEYIGKIKENNIAKAVKIADLQHNMDLTRLENITEHDKNRNKKYGKALSILVYGK